MTMLEETVEKLKGRGGKPAQFKDMVSVTVAKDELVDAISEAKKAGFEMLSDVFGTDYLRLSGPSG